MTTKRRFDNQLLTQVCERDNITLTKDYTNEKLTKRTIIEAQCVNYETFFIKIY